jgi:hypothetical protein
MRFRLFTVFLQSNKIIPKKKPINEKLNGTDIFGKMAGREFNNLNR